MIDAMRNNYKKDSLHFLLVLIVLQLLSSCGTSSVAGTKTTQPSLTGTPPVSGIHNLQLQLAPKPTATTAPSPSPTPLPTSLTTIGNGGFITLPPGSPLPSDAECAARVQRSSWEPRPDNTTANHTNVYLQGHRLTGSYLARYSGYEQRVTGNFTGTTDEILQWGACKWGFDVDTVRAQAVQESYWHQSTLGDCKGGTVPETHGCQSVGILQVKGANLPPTHPGTWPYAFQSTAFNVDYVLAVRRACYEGLETWMGNGYHTGDQWGCIGRWFSGDWYGGSLSYIASVKNILAKKEWLQPGF